MAVLKFFDVVLKFEPLNARVLNFPKNSAMVLIRLVLINGDCVYVLHFKKKFSIQKNLCKIYEITKDQLILKCPFSVIVWTNTPTNFFSQDFCPSLKKDVKSKNKGTLYR